MIVYDYIVLLHVYWCLCTLILMTSWDLKSEYYIKSCHRFSHPNRRHPVVRKTLMESQQNGVPSVLEWGALKILQFPTKSFSFQGNFWVPTFQTALFAWRLALYWSQHDDFGRQISYCIISLIATNHCVVVACFSKWPLGDPNVEVSKDSVCSD